MNVDVLSTLGAKEDKRTGLEHPEDVRLQKTKWFCRWATMDGQSRTRRATSNTQTSNSEHKGDKYQLLEYMRGILDSLLTMVNEFAEEVLCWRRRRLDTAFSNCDRAPSDHCGIDRINWTARNIRKNEFVTRMCRVQRKHPVRDLDGQT